MSDDEREVKESSSLNCAAILPVEAAKDPLVTIVVPTYKRPDLLIECLRAISQQTFTNFTVLVCDNSSDAEGRSVVESLHDGRFRYVARDQNLGMLKNVVLGFMAATTELVMEVDDDDILYPRCLEFLTAPFGEHADLAIVFGDLVVIDDNREVMPRHRRVKHLPSLEFLEEGRHQPFTDLAAYGYLFLMASVFRRDCIDLSAIPASAATAYDRYVTLAASRNDSAAYFVREPVMAYRVHERSDGLRFTTQCLRGALDVLTREVPLATPQSRKLIEMEIVRTRLRLVRAFNASGERRDARREARRLLSVPGLKALTYMSVRQYLPQRLRIAWLTVRDRRGARDHSSALPA